MKHEYPIEDRDVIFQELRRLREENKRLHRTVHKLREDLDEIRDMFHDDSALSLPDDGWC